MPTGLDFERGLKRPRHRHSTMVFTFDASSTADAPHDQARDTRSLLLSGMIVCLVVRPSHPAVVPRRAESAPTLRSSAHAWWSPVFGGGLALSSSVVGVRVGQWWRALGGRSCEVRVSCRKARLVGSCLVGGRVRQVVRAGVGRAYTFAGSPDGNLRPSAPRRTPTRRNELLLNHVEHVGDRKR